MTTQSQAPQKTTQTEREVFDFETLEVGTDLGSVEFLLTEQEFAHHRQAVEYADAIWVTNELKPVAILARRRWRYRPGQRHINARHNAEYFNPPRPGKKLIFSGKVIDKYVKRDKPYVVFEVEVKDEDGLLIERYQRTRMVSAPKLGEKWWGHANRDTPIGFAVPPVSKNITFEKMKFFEAIIPDKDASTHDSEDVAREEGLGSPIASAHHTISYTHEMLNKFLGPEWTRGGKLDLKFLRPVVPGDTLTIKGVVRDKREENGKVRLILEVWGENQKGEKTAAGEASGLVE
ncbi:MAG: MaoC family dehydratase [Chloroflexi bacterium]|nr:MaoC family dehydratase [Chloroflexota bacterium]